MDQKIKARFTRTQQERETRQNEKKNMWAKDEKYIVERDIRGKYVFCISTIFVLVISHPNVLLVFRVLPISVRRAYSKMSIYV